MPIQSMGSEAQLPPWLEDVVNRATALSKGEPKPYTGQRLASPTEEMIRAGKLGGRTGLYSPYLKHAEQMVSGSNIPFTEKYKEYMNPYQQAVTNRIAEEGNRNLRENIMPAIEAKFIHLGQHGSSGHLKDVKRAGREIQNEISANQAKALAQGYQQAAQIYNADKARGLETAREMSALGGLAQGSNLADIAMLMEQGRYGQQQQQAQNDISYQDYLKDQNYPWEMLNNLSSIIHGMPKDFAQQYSTYQTPGTPQLNLLGQAGGLASTLLGSLFKRS